MKIFIISALAAVALGKGQTLDLGDANDLTQDKWAAINAAETEKLGDPNATVTQTSKEKKEQLIKLEIQK
jgi:hypothetical protein